MTIVLTVIIFLLLLALVTVLRKPRRPDEAADLAIFSEGRIYWPYFKDIIDELVNKGVNFTYYTLDKEDPAFRHCAEFDIRYMGSGAFGYARISGLRQRYLLSTTPNIGTPGYPVQKPKMCENMIHIFHSVSGVATYHKYSLDKYDTVILSGAVFAEDIRILERKRGLAAKELLIGGLPYVDSIIERASAMCQATNGKTVLIASTWNKRGCLRTYGAEFIINIADAGYDVIVRPHPFSFKFEKEFIDGLIKAFEPYPNIRMDDEIDSLKSLAGADILISDISGVRLDYNFAFNRPVVSLETDDEEVDEYEHADIGYYWSVDISSDIGVYIKREDIGTITDVIRENIGRTIKIDKELVVSNIGSSAKIIAGQITALIG